AGSPMNVTVTAKDQFGNTATGYTGTIHFTSNDGQAVAGAGLPANYTFVAGDNGVHVFTNGVTLKTVGSRTVTAADTVTSTITGTTRTVTFWPAPPSILSFPTRRSSDLAGSPMNVTVTAKDQFGNTATGYTGTVHFSSSDTQAIAGAGLPANYTFVA